MFTLSICCTRACRVSTERAASFEIRPNLILLHLLVSQVGDLPSNSNEVLALAPELPRQLPARLQRSAYFFSSLFSSRKLIVLYISSSTMLQPYVTRPQVQGNPVKLTCILSGGPRTTGKMSAVCCDRLSVEPEGAGDDHVENFKGSLLAAGRTALSTSCTRSAA